MAHLILIGDDGPCAFLRGEFVRCGHTVAVAAPGDATGVDACDVVVVVGAPGSTCGPDTAPAGGRGAAAAAPRIFLADAVVQAGLTPALRSRLEAAVGLAREMRLSARLAATEPAVLGDVQQVGHELRSPLTAIKTALEVMDGDLRTWSADPADLEAQSRMLEIALRNVRRLHRAVEWSQMLLSAASEDVSSPKAAAPPAPAPEAALHAGGHAA
ncbi:hypothetical protein FJ250_08135 [bacterium]|nr:hypothetical protein [bacterium]